MNSQMLDKLNHDDKSRKKKIQQTESIYIATRHLTEKANSILVFLLLGLEKKDEEKPVTPAETKDNESNKDETEESKKEEDESKKEDEDSKKEESQEANEETGKDEDKET